MKVQKFLQQNIKQSLWQAYSKVCFIVHDQFPILFFSQLITHVRSNFDGIVEHLDLELQDQSTICSRIENVGFLSSKTFYWLGNLSGLSSKKRKKWIEYVHGYSGSHVLGIALSQDDARLLDKEWFVVDIPPVVDRTDFELIARFFHPQKVAVYKRLARFVSPYSKMPLDKACLLLQYGQVLGNNVQQFCDEWLPMLIESEQSLFKVSEYLLSNRASDFFRLWAKVRSNYPDVFWIAFWSDTLWRAYHYIRAMQRHDLSEAKRMSYKLPFSFINGGWKKVDPLQLKRAHHFVYNLDYNLKNGTGTYGLELLYGKFFLEQFVTKGNNRRENERGRHYSATPVI